MDVSFSQLYQASKQCRQGKAKGSQCQRYEANLLENLLDTQAALQSYTWQPLPMRKFVAVNGSKPREIHSPAYADRVVHHWIVPQLQVFIEPKFIHDCAANIKGKGTHFAVNRLQKMFCQVVGGGYFLQLDIHNFFYSINRNTLLALLTKHLRGALRDQKISHQQAKDFYWLCQTLLKPALVYSGGDATRTDPLMKQLPHHKQLKNAAQHCGLPIGNLTSQFFSNVYLNELDQYVKHQLKCQHYVRYVDDFILVHKSREQLALWQAKISQFIQQHLQLRLKDEKHLQATTQGADFLGYIVRPHYQLVRRRVVGNWHNKLKTWHQKTQNSAGRYQLPPETLNQLQSMCASYVGHCKQASYFSVLQRLLDQHQWLNLFYNINNGQLLPKWQNRCLGSFAAQCLWFVSQYANTQVYVQKGRQFVNALQPRLGYPLGQLSLILERLRHQSISYAWVAENGYARRLKHRQLTQLFIPNQGKYDD